MVVKLPESETTARSLAAVAMGTDEAQSAPKLAGYVVALTIDRWTTAPPGCGSKNVPPA